MFADPGAALPREGHIGRPEDLSVEALLGRGAVPAQWRPMALACRPLPSRALRPRPGVCWTVDVLEIAEHLLLAGAA